MNTEDPSQPIKPLNSSSWLAGITSGIWCDLVTTNKSLAHSCGQIVDSRSKVQINFSINFLRKRFRFLSWFIRYAKRVQATHKQTRFKACSINWISKRPQPRSHLDPQQRELESLLKNNKIKRLKKIKTPMTIGVKELPPFIKWETRNPPITKV